MNPRVSITMPVLNGERFIGQAIESIMHQTYRDFELIVVDDGSTDHTPDCVESFREKLNLKYIRHPRNLGIAPSVNEGLRHSSGEFIAFLDHDDRWLPEFLETQVKHLESHPDVAMVHSDFQLVDVEGSITCESVARWRGRKTPSGSVFRQLFGDSFIVGNSVLIRKSCLDRIGGFDEEFRFGDYHLWLRMARHYNIDYTDRPLTQYRQHASQSTRNVPVGNPAADSAVKSIENILQLYPEVREEVGETAVRRRLASLYFGLAYSFFAVQAFRNARVFLLKAIQLSPGNFRYLLLYAACLLPTPLVQGLRRGWRGLSRFGIRRRKQAGAQSQTAGAEVWQGR